MKEFRRRYAIRAALASDAGSSVAYLFEPDTEEATRVYLRIKSEHGKTLWCEGIINDRNYRRRYNEDTDRRTIIPGVPTLAIGAWYRDLLRIKRGTDQPLRIRMYRRSKWTWAGWWGSVRVSQQHPVSTNRIAMNLALLGAALGIISLLSPFVHL
jgi:hypothetical protein